jgi:hypothetical protein
VAVLAGGEEGDGRVGESGARKDVAGFGRRVGVHGGDVKGEKRLDVRLVELALSDGDRHATSLAKGAACGEVKL